MNIEETIKQAAKEIKNGKDAIEAIIDASEDSGEDISQIASRLGSRMTHGKWKASLEAAKQIYYDVGGRIRAKYMQMAMEQFQEIANVYEIQIQYDIDMEPWQLDAAVQQALAPVLRLPKKCYDGYVNDAAIELIRKGILKRIKKTKHEGKDMYEVRYDLIAKDLNCEMPELVTI